MKTQHNQNYNYKFTIYKLKMSLIKKLEKYGLNEREAKVLVSLYSNRDATSFKISKETGIPKTTVYDILDSLLNKKLVSSWKKNNVTYYFAESPNPFGHSL